MLEETGDWRPGPHVMLNTTHSLLVLCEQLLDGVSVARAFRWWWGEAGGGGMRVMGLRLNNARGKERCLV